MLSSLIAFHKGVEIGERSIGRNEAFFNWEAMQVNVLFWISGTDNFVSLNYKFKLVEMCALVAEVQTSSLTIGTVDTEELTLNWRFNSGWLRHDFAKVEQISH